mmetsp:Transcript_30036/g.45318  ORF Transcript_30036/g.45318 Transcript_30036/m.45318 type:complete len:82 (+) Transcript_30036:1292-1537(+)
MKCEPFWLGEQQRRKTWHKCSQGFTKKAKPLYNFMFNIIRPKSELEKNKIFKHKVNAHLTQDQFYIADITKMRVFKNHVSS